MLSVMCVLDTEEEMGDGLAIFGEWYLADITTIKEYAAIENNP